MATIRLGTTLVSEGVITADELEEARKNQVLYGGRIGTCLVELGYLPADVLSQWLGRIHNIPCVTTAMLDAVPDETLRLITPELAERYECVPLRKEGKKLTVAMTNPTDLAGMDALTFKTGCRIVPQIVPESLLFQVLTDRLGVKREIRYVQVAAANKPSVGTRAPPPPVSQPPLPTAVPPPTPPPLIRPPPTPILTPGVTMEPRSMPSIRRGPQPPPMGPPPMMVMAAPAPTVPMQPAPISVVPNTTVSMRSPTPVGSPPSIPPAPDPAAFERLMASLAKVTTRDDLAAVVLGAATAIYDSAVLLRVQDKLAAGWAGMGRGVDAARVSALVLPLTEGSFFCEAVDYLQPAGGALVANPAHDTFLAALQLPRPKSAVVAPVIVRNHVVNLIYADRRDREDAMDVAPLLAQLAAYTAGAYERILIASRKK